jgi:hypothetical protein
VLRKPRAQRALMVPSAVMLTAVNEHQYTQPQLLYVVMQIAAVSSRRLAMLAITS